MFGFFTSLADAYSAVLMPDKGLKERLSSDASDRCDSLLVVVRVA
jgi:splicing factor 3A subunit 1